MKAKNIVFMLCAVFTFNKFDEAYSAGILYEVDHSNPSIEYKYTMGGREYTATITNGSVIKKAANGPLEERLVMEQEERSMHLNPDRIVSCSVVVLANPRDLTQRIAQSVGDPASGLYNQTQLARGMIKGIQEVYSASSAGQKVAPFCIELDQSPESIVTADKMVNTAASILGKVLDQTTDLALSGGKKDISQIGADFSKILLKTTADHIKESVTTKDVLEAIERANKKTVVVRPLGQTITDNRDMFVASMKKSVPISSIDNVMSMLGTNIQSPKTITDAVLEQVKMSQIPASVQQLGINDASGISMPGAVIKILQHLGHIPSSAVASDDGASESMNGTLPTIDETEMYHFFEQSGQQYVLDGIADRDVLIKEREIKTGILSKFFGCCC